MCNVVDNCILSFAGYTCWSSLICDTPGSEKAYQNHPNENQSSTKLYDIFAYSSLGRLSIDFGRSDYDAAIIIVQRLLRYDPLLESAYRRLMRLCVDEGDRAAALRAYHTCASVLERELNAVPSRATRDAYECLNYLFRSEPKGSLWRWSTDKNIHHWCRLNWLSVVL